MNHKLIGEECRAMSAQLRDIADNIDMPGERHADTPPVLEVLDELAYVSEKLDSLVDYVGRPTGRTGGVLRGVGNDT